MALGKSDIEDIKETGKRIAGRFDDTYDCWNTFQYVVRNLEEWAEETTIGNEAREELKDLVTKIGRLDSYTKEYLEKLERLIDEQELINRV